MDKARLIQAYFWLEGSGLDTDLRYHYTAAPSFREGMENPCGNSSLYTHATTAMEVLVYLGTEPLSHLLFSVACSHCSLSGIPFPLA